MTETPQDRPVSVDPQRLRLTDQSGGAGVLMGQRCRRCQVCVFGPAVFCQACSSDDLESVQLGRQGTLYSFTVVRVPPSQVNNGVAARNRLLHDRGVADITLDLY